MHGHTSQFSNIDLVATYRYKFKWLLGANKYDWANYVPQRDDTFLLAWPA